MTFRIGKQVGLNLIPLLLKTHIFSLNRLIQNYIDIKISFVLFQVCLCFCSCLILELCTDEKFLRSIYENISLNLSQPFFLNRVPKTRRGAT